jgi:putative nucleotidyltransferase with HDIG domain
MNDITQLRIRLTWRLFLLTGSASVFACVTTLFAQTMSGSLRAGAILTLLAGLILGAVFCSLVARQVARQSHELANAMRLASRLGASQRVEATQAGIFSEVASEWHRALEELAASQFEHQTLAASHYKSLTDFIRMISKAVDERTSHLRGHAERVSAYSVEIARELKLNPDETERIRLSALLHDIGTMGVDDSLVTRDGPLTAEEFEIVKAHTVKGASILRSIESLSDLIPGVELHHESLDGRGYPYGLQGDEIPLMPRIIAVADSFDAMTSARPYQPAMDPQYVLEVMNRLSGTRYDLGAVQALARSVESGAIQAGRCRPQMTFRQKRQCVSTG